MIRTLRRLLIGHGRTERLLRTILFPDVNVTIELFGARLRVNRREESSYVNANRLSNRSWILRDDGAALINLALLIQPGDTFVDVGANIGLYSAVLVRAMDLYPDIKFYAFEAMPSTATRLRVSLSERSVTVINQAASDHCGYLEFRQGLTSLTASARVQPGAFQLSGRSIRIPATTLDASNIDGTSIVLKVDVEGHEREVISGAMELFRAQRIKAVYIEGYDDSSLPAELMSLGFVCFDGRTLRSANAPYHLLAIHRKHLGSAPAQ